jgi:hypothetical protein
VIDGESEGGYGGLSGERGGTLAGGGGREGGENKGVAWRLGGGEGEECRGGSEGGRFGGGRREDVDAKERGVEDGEIWKEVNGSERTGEISEGLACQDTGVCRELVNGVTDANAGVNQVVGMCGEGEGLGTVHVVADIDPNTGATLYKPVCVSSEQSINCHESGDGRQLRFVPSKGSLDKCLLPSSSGHDMCLLVSSAFKWNFRTIDTLRDVVKCG